ncbi:unnamed protein product [Danaus chrysippus]|uniref:(African queen) hypothetical protein n=1 Tax=Danaus chrysippus TaxID=151541 RepID=A0A8J2R0D1_9NEOP|nr:unnamed protein product [Danaus chrysippus]
MEWYSERAILTLEDEQAASINGTMKVQFFALLSLVASIYAFPSLEDNVYELGQPIQKNAAEDRVREGFAKFIEKIQSAGYDPLEIDRREINMNIAIIGLIFEAFIENVRISGLSDIHISSLEYSYLFNRLRIDVYIPQIDVLFDNTKFGAISRRQEYEGEMNGNVYINEFRIRGVVYVNVNVIGQVSLRSISLDSSLKGIEADINAVINGNDGSEYMNNLFSVRIPAFFNNNKARTMKLQFFALLSLVASIYAFPSLESNVYGQPIQKNAAEHRVIEGFAKLIEKIQNEGYEQLEIDRRKINMNVAIVGLIFEAFIENVRISGLSDIRISSLEYSYLFNRLRIDVYIPQIDVLFDNTKFGAISRRLEYEGEMNGNVYIKEFRIRGVVYVDVDVIGQVSLRSISLDSSLKGIEV